MTYNYKYVNIKSGDKMNNEANNNNNNTPINNTQLSTKKNNPVTIILVILGVIVIGSLLIKILIFGIAASSVYSTNDKTKLLSINGYAQTAAASIKTKIAEESVYGDLSKVYSSELSNSGGYNLSTYNGKKISTSNPAIYYISNDLSNILSLSSNTYNLSNSTIEVTNKNKMDKSFFVYTGENVILCLIVNKNSGYYIKGAAIKKRQKISISDNVTVSLNKGTMFSCSNNQNSWQDISVNN